MRERDGLVWNWERYGPMHHASGQALVEHLQRLGPIAARPGFFGRVYCRGWYVDPERRFARMYTCNSSHDEAPVWAGWDVDEALEGRFDIAALIGEPSTDDEHVAFLDAWRGCEAASLVTTKLDEFVHVWDPMTRTLRYGWYYHYGVDISVVDHTGFVTHHGFADPTALFAALGHGPILLDELATTTPCPDVVSEHGGAIIDARTKTIVIWHRYPIAPDTLATLRDRWPGWTFERERDRSEGHRQRTNLLPTIRTIEDPSL